MPSISSFLMTWFGEISLTWYVFSSISLHFISLLLNCCYLQLNACIICNISFIFMTATSILVWARLNSVRVSSAFCLGCCVIQVGPILNCGFCQFSLSVNWQLLVTVGSLAVVVMVRLYPSQVLWVFQLIHFMS